VYVFAKECGMKIPTYFTGDAIAQGDWIRVYVPRLGVWHHGIVQMIPGAWNGFTVRIVHNMKATGVTICDWYEFSDGQPIQLYRRAASMLQVREILERLNANIGKPYHLFAQNCEHFASFAFTGKAESKSVQAVGWVAAGVIVVGLLARR
jgi:Lecithin retinol acyltransferase